MAKKNLKTFFFEQILATKLINNACKISLRVFTSSVAVWSKILSAFPHFLTFCFRCLIKEVIESIYTKGHTNLKKNDGGGKSFLFVFRHKRCSDNAIYIFYLKPIFLHFNILRTTKNKCYEISYLLKWESKKKKLEK